MSAARAAPLIGITVYGPDEDAIAPAVSLPVAYAEAVSRAGGLPVLLPPVFPVPDALLSELDGVVIAGGGDIDPSVHTDRTHPHVYMVTPRRDRFELELTRRALDRPELPVLGICRGMQILNVALGGDLELHLPDVFGDAVAHRAPPRAPVEHDVELEPGSALEAIYGGRHLRICSWHHQAIRRPGRDLARVARAPDGVIEGIEYAGHPWAIGVQWHPEMQPDDPIQDRLWRALVEKARRRR